MLGNAPYNFRTIEKISAAFGWIFQDITIERVNPATQAVKAIKIPIEQAAKEKWAQRLISDPDAGNEAKQKHVQIVLPRMAYELTGFRFDGRRKLSPIYYRVSLDPDNNQVVNKQLNPVPFIFNFALYLQTRTLDDGFAILEQFLPFFQPDFSVPVLTIPELNIQRDILFTMTSNTQTDSYEGQFLDKRLIDWQFDFEARGELYPPIRQKKVITNATINMDDELLTHVEVMPTDAQQDEAWEAVETPPGN